MLMLLSYSSGMESTLLQTIRQGAYKNTRPGQTNDFISSAVLQILYIMYKGAVLLGME